MQQFTIVFYILIHTITTVHYSFYLVHGGVTEWNPWNVCDKACGNGTSSRKRYCTKPVPKYRGEFCTEPLNDKRTCVRSPCIRKLKVVSVLYVITFRRFLENSCFIQLL